MKNKLIAYSFLLTFPVLQFWSCKKNGAPQTEKVYRFSETMTVDGRARTYTLNLPPDYYNGADFSLVIALHGGGGDALQFESTSELTSKANAAQFIVVYPEGVKSTGALAARTWNAGGCCDYARDNNIDDVNFIRQLIDKLLAGYKINPKKIYSTGHSNGGMLAYRLACEIPNKIAAIAPNGCSMAVTQCNPSRPVPVLHMHSVLDTKVPYQGGSGSGIGTSGVYFPPIDSVLNAWSLKNTCITTAQVLINNSNYRFTKWSDCNNSVTIQYYLTMDGGHGWPGGLPGGPISDTPSVVINANDLLWDFFQQYQLP
ncbi:MAG TPA: PHB depolymerase family esterase [Chitinophagaceae bacterium]|nr:PHB depolymerase family esterase [Chitinophagaceae bacterium]